MKFKPVLSYIALILIWGFSWFAIKLQLNGTSPMLSIALRFGLSAILLFAYCKIKRLPLSFPAHLHFRMFILGVTLFAGPFLLLYAASEVLPGGIVALLFSSTLVFSVLAEYIFLGGKLDVYKLVSCVMGIGGLGLITLSQVEFASRDATFALACGMALLGAAIGSYGGVVSANNRKLGINLIEGNAYAMGYTAFMLLFVCLLRGESLIPNLTPIFVGAWLYLSLLASVIGFGLYLQLAQKVGLAQASYATVLFPLVALLASSLFEDLHWTNTMFLGIALVFVGNIALVQSKVRES
jgi:drug/metabolite transporter (DMT)-like permease